MRLFPAYRCVSIFIVWICQDRTADSRDLVVLVRQARANHSIRDPSFNIASFFRFMVTHLSLTHACSPQNVVRRMAHFYIFLLNRQISVWLSGIVDGSFLFFVVNARYLLQVLCDSPGYGGLLFLIFPALFTQMPCFVLIVQNLIFPETLSAGRIIC